MHNPAMENKEQSTDDQEALKGKVINAIKDVYDPENPCRRI